MSRTRTPAHNAAQPTHVSRRQLIPFPWLMYALSPDPCHHLFLSIPFRSCPRATVLGRQILQDTNPNTGNKSFETVPSGNSFQLAAGACSNALAILSTTHEGSRA